MSFRKTVLLSNSFSRSSSLCLSSSESSCSESESELDSDSESELDDDEDAAFLISSLTPFDAFWGPKTTVRISKEKKNFNKTLYISQKQYLLKVAKSDSEKGISKILFWYHSQKDQCNRNFWKKSDNNYNPIYLLPNKSPKPKYDYLYIWKVFAISFFNNFYNGIINIY